MLLVSKACMCFLSCCCYQIYLEVGGLCFYICMFRTFDSELCTYNMFTCICVYIKLYFHIFIHWYMFQNIYLHTSYPWSVETPPRYPIPGYFGPIRCFGSQKIRGGKREAVIHRASVLMRMKNSWNQVPWSHGMESWNTCSQGPKVLVIWKYLWKKM